MAVLFWNCWRLSWSSMKLDWSSLQVRPRLQTQQGSFKQNVLKWPLVPSRMEMCISHIPYSNVFKENSVLNNTFTDVWKDPHSHFYISRKTFALFLLGCSTKPWVSGFTAGADWDTRKKRVARPHPSLWGVGVKRSVQKVSPNSSWKSSPSFSVPLRSAYGRSLRQWFDLFSSYIN